VKNKMKNVMSWLRDRKAPKVVVEGNKFTIVPQDEDELIDVNPESTSLAVRRETQIPERLAPKVGTIPKHSWGA
jgi:hypothetical protein